MSDEPVTPQQFYREKVPAQFNRTLSNQERAVETAQRELDSMRAVNATIRVDVRDADPGTFFLNIADGVMTAGETASHPPFLTLIQSLAAYESVASEAGDSALGMLGGLSGLTGEMKLTAGRIRNLAGVKGCIRFEVTGEDGFVLLVHLGPEPVPEVPDTRISVDGEGYRALRGGEIDPQQAFMTGKIKVEGDMQLAMQLALAALSPD